MKRKFLILFIVGFAMLSGCSTKVYFTIRHAEFVEMETAGSQDIAIFNYHDQQIKMIVKWKEHMELLNKGDFYHVSYYYNSSSVRTDNYKIVSLSISNQALEKNFPEYE